MRYIIFLLVHLSCPKSQPCVITKVNSFSAQGKGVIQACDAYIKQMKEKKPAELDLLFYSGSTIKIIDIGKQCLQATAETEQPK